MGHRYAILSSSSKVLHVHFSMTTSLQRQYYHSLISDQNIICLEVTQWDCHGNRQKVSRSPIKPLYVKTFWVHCLFLLKTKPNFPKYDYNSVWETEPPTEWSSSYWYPSSLTQREPQNTAGNEYPATPWEGFLPDWMIVM